MMLPLNGGASLRRRLPVVLLAAGCAACSPASSDAPGDAATESSCDEVEVGVAPFTALSAEINDVISTVIDVSWETEPNTSTFIRYWADEKTTHERQSDSTDGFHSATLVGFTGATEVSVQLFAEVDGETVCTPVQQLTTGSLPAALPPITVETFDAEAAAGGFTVVAVLTEDGVSPAIFNEDGDYVWYFDTDNEYDVTTLRADMSQDGDTILVSDGSYGDGTGDSGTDGLILEIGLDGSVETVAAPNLGLDFVEIDSGHYAYLGYEVGTMKVMSGEDLELIDVFVDTIVEVTSDGSRQTVWTAWDILPTDDPNAPHLVNQPEQLPDVHFFTHFNGISYDASEDAFLLSQSSLGGGFLPDMILKVDRASGNLDWTLSDEAGDFQNADDTSLVNKPHSSRLLDDGTILVFNRYDMNKDDVCSEATVITLDETEATATRSWSYVADPCLSVTYLGHAERIWNDNTVSIYSSAGQIDEATQDGTLVWQASMSLGAAFGHGERFQSLD